MSEERLSKIEDKVNEHERSITQLTYISNELKSILEKMNEKLDALHNDWSRTMSDVRSYTDMQRLFKETTDNHETRIRDNEDWIAQQKGKGMLEKALWSFGASIFGGFVTAVMVMLLKI